MLRSRTATTALTCLIGLGSVVSLAIPAQAESPAQSTDTRVSSAGGHGDPNGPIIAYPTTPPTQPGLPKAPKPMEPGYDDYVITGIPQGPVDPHVPDGEVDVYDSSGGQNDPCAPLASCPQDDDCVPSTTNGPNPCEEGECDPIARERGDCDEPCEQPPPTAPRDRDEQCGDPCDEDGPGHAARDRGDDCDDPCIEEHRPEAPRMQDPSGSTGGTDGSTTGGTDDPNDRPGTPERCPGTGTTGGTGGGSTGGGDLPRTGTEVLPIAGVGAALTGIGAALKKLSNRAARAA